MLGNITKLLNEIWNSAIWEKGALLLVYHPQSVEWALTFRLPRFLPFNYKSLLVSCHHYQSGLLWVAV